VIKLNNATTFATDLYKKLFGRIYL